MASMFGPLSVLGRMKTSEIPIATANLITRFECISGFYSQNEFKMKDRHYPYRLKTGERS